VHGAPRAVRLFVLARAAVLAIAALLLCRDLAGPFNTWHAVNDALYTEAARNHVRYGLVATRLYATYPVVPGEPPRRYVNHPPLVAVLTAVPLAVFGDHEWAARLMPILATLGSTALLVTMLGRLGSPLLGLLAGFFFATLPLTEYFGRMVNHEAPVQFFSLLMLHGYLQWTSAYGPRYGARRGALAWAAGTVLGIGTGWAVLLASGLVWCWHALRVRRRTAAPRPLLWLTLLPALTLAAVLVHILAGSGWDVGALVALVQDRSVGGEGARHGWLEWLAMQRDDFASDFTWPGAIAALLSVPLVVLALLRRGDRRRWPWLPLTRGPAVVAAICGLQGLLWVVLLKNQAWFHDYWQFYLGPYVAISLAALVQLARQQLGRRAPRLAAAVVVVLLLAPMPFAAATRDLYASRQLVYPEYLQALRMLGGLVPKGTPVWTSHHVRGEAVMARERRYPPHPVVAYYAERPVYFSRDLAEVRANAPGCAAYVLRRVDAPWARAMEAALGASFPSVRVGENHVIFLLTPPPASPPPGGR